MGLDAIDLANIYLVAGGLKPATFVSEEDRPYGSTRIYPSDFKYRVMKIKRRLQELNLLYAFKVAPLDASKLNDNDMDWSLLSAQFTVAKTEENLQSLISANTDKEYGLALGYPKEAVDAFLTIQNGIKINGNYKAMQIIRAKKAGIQIPTWLAYTSHVLEKIDLVSKDVSQSSEHLGIKYQQYIREKDPKLAELIEKEHALLVATYFDYELADNSYIIKYLYVDGTELNSGSG